MKTRTIAHSDQIVAYLAKKPVSFFGSPMVKEVALTFASMYDKSKGWSVIRRVNTVAEKVGCSARTVRRAIKVLGRMDYMGTKHRKHETVEHFNYASEYSLGKTLLDEVCAFISRSVRRSTQACQGISLKSLFKNKAPRKNAPTTGSVDNNRKQKSKPMPLNVPTSPAQAIEAARESALRGLAKMRTMLPPELWTTQGATV